LLEKAWSQIGQKDIDGALKSVEIAAAFDPQLLTAQMLHAELLAIKGDYAGAQAQLVGVLSAQSNNTDAAELKEICRRAPGNPTATATALGIFFTRRKEYTLADTQVRSGDSLLKEYRTRLNAAWPGLNVGNELRQDEDGKCHLTFPYPGNSRIDNISPLGKLPLSSLDLRGHPVKDLSALKEMTQLRRLAINNTQVTQLGPLARIIHRKRMA